MPPSQTGPFRPSIPPEIQAIILQNLNATAHRQELKSCRLLTRSFYEAATPLLFSTLHFSVSLLSLNRLKAIAAAPHLAEHVRRLTLHRGSWEVYLTEFDDETTSQILENPTTLKDNPQHWAIQSRGIPLSIVITNQQNELFDENLATEVQSQILLRKDWVKSLHDLLAKSPFVHLSEVLLPDFSSDIKSDYHARTTGRYQEIEDVNPQSCVNFSNVLKMRTPPMALKSLILESVSVECFGSCSLVPERTRLALLFQELETLSLVFNNENLVNTVRRRSIYVPQLSGCSHFMAACAHNLQQLSIGAGSPSAFTTQKMDKRREYQHDISEIICSTQFPRLRSLTLSNVVLEEDIILDFLSNHAPTLRDLSITNWTLPLHRGEIATTKMSKDSFTKAIWRIPQVTQLRTARLRGFFFATTHYGRGQPCYIEAQNNTDDRPRPKPRSKFKSRSQPQPQPTSTPESCPANTDVNSTMEPAPEPNMLTKIEAYLTHRGPFPFPPAVLRHLDQPDTSSLEEALLQEPDHLIWDRGTVRDVWSLDRLRDVVACSDESWKFIVPGKRG